MKKEIEFQKYKNRGADYHYKQIQKWNFKKFNAFAEARYFKHIELVKIYLNKFYSSANHEIKILDVGCGDGVLIYLLKKSIKGFNLKFYGIDSSNEALCVAKNKIPDGVFNKNDVYNLGFENEFFDLVISLDVIEHINYPEKMLSEINRITKIQGLILIGTPIRLTEKPIDKMHIKEFFQKELIDLFSGFFTFIELFESHNQLYSLKYIKQTKFFKIGINRYLYNILSFFGKNPFIEKYKTSNNLPTYMFIVCRK
jgi:ubiquinone/menaquinone biosynthesis C-methylase UbiE